MVGVGNETDAYIAAQALPAVVFSILVPAFQSVWLPKLAVLDKNYTEWRNQQSIAQSQALLLGGGINIFIWLAKEFWVGLLFPGFTPNQIELTTALIGPLLLATTFSTQTSLLVIALRARGHLIVGELIPMLATFLSLLLLIKLIPSYGIESAAWVAEARAILVFLVLYIVAGRPSFNLKKGFLETVTWKSMSPILFGSSIYKTSPLIDRYWTSHGLPGAVTIYSLSQYVITAIATLIERTICMPILPSFARYVSSGDYVGLRKTYRKGLKRITVTVLVVLALFLISYPVFIYILQTIFNIKPEIAMGTWVIILLLAGSLHVAVSGSLAVACFYSMNDTKTPVAIGIKGFILGAILKTLGYILYGLNGLAVATSIYYLINLIMFDYGIRRKINEGAQLV